MNKDYIPHPIDTSMVELDDELNELVEKIAENVHDIWGEGRWNEGWRYGEKKDADLKVTPLMVPYSDLPESEKDYDRNTALGTIKMIIKLGYKIVKEE